MTISFTAADTPKIAGLISDSFTSVLVQQRLVGLLRDPAAPGQLAAFQRMFLIAGFVCAQGAPEVRVPWRKGAHVAAYASLARGLSLDYEKRMSDLPWFQLYTRHLDPLLDWFKLPADVTVPLLRWAAAEREELGQALYGPLAAYVSAPPRPAGTPLAPVPEPEGPGSGVSLAAALSGAVDYAAGELEDVHARTGRLVRQLAVSIAQQFAVGEASALEVLESTPAAVSATAALAPQDRTRLLAFWCIYNTVRCVTAWVEPERPNSVNFASVVLNSAMPAMLHCREGLEESGMLPDLEEMISAQDAAFAWLDKVAGR